jgi:hypothetical protein
LTRPRAARKLAAMKPTTLSYSKLDPRHTQTEDYRQRMLTKDWQRILLNYQDEIVFKGNVRKLIAKNIGCGVVEIYKEKILR